MDIYVQVTILYTYSSLLEYSLFQMALSKESLCFSVPGHFLCTNVYVFCINLCWKCLYLCEEKHKIQLSDVKNMIWSILYLIFIILWMKFFQDMYVSVLFCVYCLGKWHVVLSVFTSVINSFFLNKFPLHACFKVSPFSFGGRQIWRFVTAPDAEGIPSASVSDVLNKGT